MATEAPRRRSVTIRDVADGAGVTPSTVSRALNGEPRIAAITRARVMAVVEELGYRPSRTARSLRAARTYTVGLLAPNLANPVGHEYMHGAVRAAAELGYAVFTCDGQGSAAVQEALLARLLEHRVDGLLIGPGVLHLNETLAEARHSLLPVEPAIEFSDEFDRLSPEVVNHNPKRPDLEHGASLAAYRELIALGHRRFAFVQLLVSDGTGLGTARRETLRQALSEAGLGTEAMRYVPIRSSDGLGPSDECVREIGRLLNLERRPSAIVSGSHVIAPHLLRGIRDAGLRMPDDLSFLSDGDSEWAAAYVPPIAAIRHDHRQAGDHDLRRLVARAEGTPIPDLPTPPSEFLPRGSIGPVPPAAV